MPFSPALTGTRSPISSVIPSSSPLCLPSRATAQELKAGFDADDETVRAWRHAFFGHGFGALETMVSTAGTRGPFGAGDPPSVADVMLVPQLSVARRLGVFVASYERLLHIEARCPEIEAFSRAAPA